MTLSQCHITEKQWSVNQVTKAQLSSLTGKVTKNVTPMSLLPNRYKLHVKAKILHKFTCKSRA